VWRRGTTETLRTAGGAISTGTVQSAVRVRRSRSPVFKIGFGGIQQAPSKLQINYQPVGFGRRIRQLMNETVFFRRTDGPMTDEQLQRPRDRSCIPTVLGAVVPAYKHSGPQWPS